MIDARRRCLNASFDREEKLNKGSGKGETKNYRQDELSIVGQSSKCQQYALVSILEHVLKSHGAQPHIHLRLRADVREMEGRHVPHSVI
jgi:hypothetical protein